MTSTVNLHMAVIGAGPVGLALALQAARVLPQARITLFDARSVDRDVAADPRTLALSLGSVQILDQLGVWPAIEASGAVAEIREVHVSQQQPVVLPAALAEMLPRRFERVAQVLREEPQVRICAVDEGVPRLGAVASYGSIVAPLQSAWMALQAREPERLFTRFGTSVHGVKAGPDGVEVDADIAEDYDLAVVAEGGVFNDQSKKSWPEGVSRDYRQTAWIGTVALAAPHGGVAYERFTPHGPAALLPLPPLPDQPHRAALVWCVPADDDPVQPLSDTQRLALLGTVFHPQVGAFTGLSPLKAFALGLNAERKLVDGRSVRIGNAAQTLHPVAGQGLNLGLRDVIELVRALQADASIEAALAHFGRRRLPDRWALIGATDFLARSFTWPLPALATARGLGLAAVQHLGGLKSAVARGLMFGLR